MITRGMKILIPARHGLGDVLAAYFIQDRGRTILAKVRAGLATGEISSAMVVFEAWYNASTGNLFRALPFDLLVRSTAELTEVADHDIDNRMPQAVRWHQNIYTNAPAQFDLIDAPQVVECPIRPPKIELPEDFILFSDGASAPDRLLNDHRIYDFLRDVTGLPIVKVGAKHNVVPADVNLCDKLDIVETLFLAKRAKLVVSALTMLRTASGLFGTPVIELTESKVAETLRRTRWEYESGLYGMRPGLNRWFRWPSDRPRIQQALRELSGHSRG
jgi:hypothetical protein